MFHSFSAMAGGADSTSILYREKVRVCKFLERENEDFQEERNLERREFWVGSRGGERDVFKGH